MILNSFTIFCFNLLQFTTLTKIISNIYKNLAKQKAQPMNWSAPNREKVSFASKHSKINNKYHVYCKHHLNGVLFCLATKH